VPLFVSIGYSACHWCHVMERECFEDEQVARLMNEHLVAVKVDREELPAVDHLFMAYCQGMTGSGGWPLTVVLTPAGKPFFAGTYFPRESGVGRPGLLELAPLLGRVWREQREQVLRTADELERALAARLRAEPGRIPGPDLVEEAKEELARMYDSRWGGFGSAPKFPTVPWLLFLLRYAERHGGDGRARVMLEETLRAMRLGGIYDHLGYGFHRYSTDAGWLVPHFEKMLYDQALLALAYTEAFRLWGDAAFRGTAAEIFAYVLRDLQAPDGGFAAAEDADSEGEEGRFYLWGVDEVTACSARPRPRICSAFHMRAAFTEVGGAGRNILPALAAGASRAISRCTPAGCRRRWRRRAGCCCAERQRPPPGRQGARGLERADGRGAREAAAVFGDRRTRRGGRAPGSCWQAARRRGNPLTATRRRGFPVLDDPANLAWGCPSCTGDGRAALAGEARSSLTRWTTFGDGAGALLLAPDPAALRQ
jgi:uncharacterized protein YyaL (SSP411 family)